MKNLILNIFLISVLISCGGGSDESDPIPTPKNPEAALLAFPVNNSECVEGTNISKTNSTILFKWNNSENTDSYELVLKNLESDVITYHIVTTNQLSIELLRGTPYSWGIISKSTSVKATATSETWKFYNAGDGVVYYAPFPAEAVSPVNGASVTATNNIITLDWSASDVDNDLASYDIYFGTTASPPSFNTGLTNSLLSDVIVTSATTYYWYVIAKDEQGNSSTSKTFEFAVN